MHEEIPFPAWTETIAAALAIIFEEELIQVETTDDGIKFLAGTSGGHWEDGPPEWSFSHCEVASGDIWHNADILSMGEAYDTEYELRCADLVEAVIHLDMLYKAGMLHLAGANP